MTLAVIENPHKTPIVVRHVEDEPELDCDLEPGVLYVVHWDAPKFWGPDNPPACCVMRCPCGCGEALSMSLMANDKPHWDLIGYEGQPATLIPSIHRKVRCKSHFWLKGGQIEWVDTPIPREAWV